MTDSNTEKSVFTAQHRVVLSEDHNKKDDDVRPTLGEQPSDKKLAMFGRPPGHGFLSIIRVTCVANSSIYKIWHFLSQD